MDRPWVVETYFIREWSELCACQAKAVAEWIAKDKPAGILFDYRIRNVETGEIVEVRDDAWA